MSDLIAKHNRIGEVLATSFQADDPVMIDWAEVGFGLLEKTKVEERIKKLEKAEKLLKEIIPLIPDFRFGVDKNLQISNYDYLKKDVDYM